MNIMSNQLWSQSAITNIYNQPFNDLIYQAHTIHRKNHEANKLQIAKLLSIKTGACPEDCNYCSQSGHFKTNIEKEKLMTVDAVLAKAQEAKEQGAKRFCMGAAWRSPPVRALPELQQMIKQVKALGLETCMTLGMLSLEDASTLKEAGLDYYNHNIDTSPSYYEKIITTRKFNDRLTTLANLREVGVKLCCGGIVGLGETKEDRIEFLSVLANLAPHPESVPINCLIPVPGTPMANTPPLEGFELVRTVATARILMPTSVVRLTAGRSAMTDELQALCYFSGANSVFIGDKLLTEENPDCNADLTLFNKLGLEAFNENLDTATN